MDRRLILSFTGALALASGLFAADAPQTNEPPARVLAPEPRKAWMDELRDKHPKLFEQLREELKNASPEERQKIVRAFRAKRPEIERLAERQRAMTDAERKAKREELKVRLEQQIAALRQKETNGMLNARESNRLERLQTIAKRFRPKVADPPSQRNDVTR